MARYRQFFCDFWNDPDVEEYSKEKKLLYTFFFTNKLTSESGIYPLTIKTMAHYTNISQKEIKAILNNGIKNIHYDWENQMIFVVKFIKHNFRGNPFKLRKSIVKDLETYHTYLWGSFKKEYSELCNVISKENKDFNKALQSYCKDNIDNDIDIDNDNDNDIKEEKEEKAFLDYFNLKTGKKYFLTPERKRIIKQRRKKYSLEQLNIAVDNFIQDDWSDRHKFIDVVYCIGVRRGIDNLERWLNWKPKSTQATSTPPQRKEFKSITDALDHVYKEMTATAVIEARQGLPRDKRIEFTNKIKADKYLLILYLKAKERMEKMRKNKQRKQFRGMK